MPSGNENEASSQTGAIAGGVTGGVAFLATAAAVAIYLKNRQQQLVAEQGGQGEIIGAQSEDLERGESDNSLLPSTPSEEGKTSPPETNIASPSGLPVSGSSIGSGTTSI